MANFEVIEKLKSLLNNGDDVDRCYAIQSLVVMQHAGANELLVNCLRDEDIDVCIDAATALGDLDAQDAIDKLIESLLNDPDGEVKTACIRSLSQLQARQAIPHLLSMIEHRPEDISFNANDWDMWWDMQLGCIKGVGTMRVAEAVPVLRRMLETEDYLDIEEVIFKTLAQIGKDGDTLLLELLDSGNARTRRRVVRAMAESSSKDTMKALARALRDETPEVRESTLNSLAKREESIHYLPIILHLFKDSDATVRKAAIAVAHQLSLRTSDDQDFSELATKLLPLLNDSDPQVKSAVLTTLPNLNWSPDKDTVAQVIRMLSENQGDCFSSVCRFIEYYQCQDAGDDLVLLLRKNQLGPEEKQHAILTLGLLQTWNEKIELLLGAYVYDAEKIVRLAALEALANLEASRTDIDLSEQEDIRLPLDMIQQALQGTLAPPFSQREIPVTIADNSQTIAADEGEDPEDIPVETTAEADDAAPAISAEMSSSENGEDFVANAMDEIASSIAAGEKPVPLSTLDSMAISCVEKQLEAQADEEQEQSEEQTLTPEEQAELQTFLDITQKNTETAKWLFNREKVPVELDIQRLAARMLGKIGNHRAILPLLETFTQTDSELKKEAALSIARLSGGESLSNEHLGLLHEEMINVLADQSRDLRIAALRVLGQLGDINCLPSIETMLDDPDTSVRIHAVRALGALAQRLQLEESKKSGLLQRLVNTLGDKETGVHRAVAEAIVPLFSGLNGAAEPLKQDAIERLIDAGLAGTDGQVKEMTLGLNALDKAQASTQLLDRLDKLETSVERRYVVEMLGELHRPEALI